MDRFYSSKKFKSSKRRVVLAMGNFDGVHIGHKEIIRRAKDKAKKLSCETCIYTFDPHPVRVLAPKHCPPLLQTLEQRLASLEELGVDSCIIEPFTKELSSVSAEDFFNDVIVKNISPACVVTGYDFTFGKGRQGTAELLEKLTKENSIELLVLEAQFLKGTLISSTNIRLHILSGDVSAAADLLGRSYSITGTVVAGRGLGGKLFVHTANLDTKNEVIPKDGVYVTTTKSLCDNKSFPSVTSIGSNPTFPGSSFAIETHVMDREIKLLGEAIEVSFLERLREQVAFKSKEELAKQIQRDIENAHKFSFPRKEN